MAEFQNTRHKLNPVTKSFCMFARKSDAQGRDG